MTGGQMSDATIDVAVPDGWVWELGDVVCDHCGATNQLHVLPDAMLAVGDWWDCNTCGKRNRRGGPPPGAPTARGLVECGHCHATFADDKLPDIAEDGSWTCPAALVDEDGNETVCGVVNRDVTAGESGSGSDYADKPEESQ
jgi:hypothetical protein